MLKMYRLYGFLGALRLLIDFVHTRLFFKGARLIRKPVYIRGRSHIHWESGFTTGVGVRLDVFSESKGYQLVFGSNVQLNDYVHIGAINSVTIGDDVLIASRVFISDHNHGDYKVAGTHSAPDVAPSKRPLFGKPIVIGDRVWIGEQVCILPGVTIGEGAVVGAGSVVTRDVPAGSVVAGNPARVLRVFDAGAQKWSKV